MGLANQWTFEPLGQQIGTGYLQLYLEIPTDACSIVRDAIEDIFAKDWIRTEFPGLQIPLGLDKL